MVGPKKMDKAATEEDGSPQKEYFVGLKENPDGSWDYSHAMKVKDPEGEFVKGVEAMDRRKKEKRAKRLEIPEDVKPGSARMVWYTMRNTIMVNEGAVNKARKEGTPNERLEALIKVQKMQQSIFNNVIRKYEHDLKKSLGADQSITAKQARERCVNLTANKMHDLVQDVINHYRWLEEEGKDEARLQRGHSFENHPIKELLKVAGDLQSRLMDEASRGGKN